MESARGRCLRYFHEPLLAVFVSASVRIVWVMQFLGPNVGLAAFETWKQVLAAAQGGLLEENQWCELKQMLPPSKPATNIELAKDLASLSVHGGVLIFGIVDNTYEVVGCDTGGMRDRIAQVAVARVHPPLSPVIHPDVRNPDDDSKAVLVVQVPPSPVAPHMVEDKYWGRSSNGKRALPDVEVRELIAARTRTTESFQARLAALVDSDLVARLMEHPPEREGHIYLMAEPCAPVLGRAADFNLMRSLQNMSGAYGPLSMLAYRSADSEGQAVSTVAGSTKARPGESCAHLLVHDDDSTIEAVASGATWVGSDETSINTPGIAGAVLRFYEIIRKLSLEHWGYAGQWRVGIHAAPLTGAVTKTSRHGPDITYPRDSYTRTEIVVPATWDEVEPEAKKLLAGFLRAVGKDDWSLHEIIQGRQAGGW